MNAPKRWSDAGGGATREEKALLEAGEKETMPNDLRERLWSSIALATVASSAAGTVTTEAASRAVGGGAPAATANKGLALLSSSLAKGVVVAVLGGIGTGAVLIHSRQTAKPAPASSSAALRPRQLTSARATAASVPEPDSRPRDAAPLSSSLGDSQAVRAAPNPGATVSSRREKLRSGTESHAEPTSPNDNLEKPAAAATVNLPVSRLREESLAVLAIRKSLLAGQAGEALRLLDRAQRDFPGGALMEEREALTVRALLVGGQKAAAQQRGAAFLRAFPRSVHAAEVRRLLDG